MFSDDIYGAIMRRFPHRPTAGQDRAARAWGAWMCRREALYLLRGYAGTGKTTLVSALVGALRELRYSVVLLAPTGRAAKVFSLYAGCEASTIHRCIYRQKSLMDRDRFEQNVNLRRGTVFIVDEASMIGHDGTTMFGTGNLLSDLIEFVYAQPDCRLLLVGDTAQLPPVGETLSRALDAGELRAYGLDVEETELTEVVRQATDSGILFNATALRRLIAAGEVDGLPRLKCTGFADVCVVPGMELIEALEQSYAHEGRDETIVVTRSNRRANLYNNGIRARVLDQDELLSGGDEVIIVKNNYAYQAGEAPFIANGDMAHVLRVRHEREMYGFRFADVTLRFPDYADAELTAVCLLTTLQSEAPALTRDEQEQLFQRVWDDYPELTDRRARMRRVRQDPYFCALQLKYAYAVTCHKAQGGQWRDVYIDQGYMTDDMLGPDYFRWLYTALTRATHRVYLVNWPESQTV